MQEALRQVGPRLRAARQARGMTLDETAVLADMSASTLSRLESGKRQASLELVLPLSRVLDVRLDDLVKEPSGDPRIRRPQERHEHMLVQPLSSEQSPNHTYKIQFDPVPTTPKLKVHDGYEWLYVISGRLRLQLGDEVVVLTRGQAAEFDTNIPHCLGADGNRPAQIISIFNQSGERMHLHSVD